MKCCIFAGPTVTREDHQLLPEAVWLPPALHGDVYRIATLLRPKAIGIIDGYFQAVPAVRHKEILWALHEGIHVFGAASMGALRAAELAPYGMRGVGRVHEAYREGMLRPSMEPFEDDDEVAVIHGPPESGYVACSEAMVNIRITLFEAQRGGIVCEEVGRRLVSIGKSFFFPDRSYTAILDKARMEGIDKAQLDRLETWLPSGRIDQKRLDAQQLLRGLNAFVASEPDPFRTQFRFEYTTLWDRLVQDLDGATPHAKGDAMVLAELRLEGQRYLKQWHAAMESLILASSESELEESQAPSDHEHLENLVRSRAQDKMRASIPSALVERHMIADLRAAKLYDCFFARGVKKIELMSREAVAVSVGEMNDLDLLGLEDWYFERCLDREIPDDLDGYLAQTGYAERRAFHEAILGEYLYRKAVGAAATA